MREQGRVRNPASPERKRAEDHRYHLGHRAVITLKKRLRRQRARLPLPVRLCVLCERPFRQGRRLRRYCTPRCRIKAGSRAQYARQRLERERRKVAHMKQED